MLAGCRGGQKTSETKTTAEDGSVQPDDIRPKLDTRFEAKYFEAQLFKSKGQSEKAYAAFMECLDIVPNEPSVQYELARIERVVYLNASSAAARIRKSIDANPSNPWYHKLQGEIYMDLGKYDLAAKSFQTTYKLNPDDPNVLYDQASALISANKLSDAIGVYDLLEKQSGPYEELSFQKHDLYMQLNQPDNAVKELEKLAESYPMEARYWGVVAQFYHQEKKPEKAKEAMEKMVRADPDNGMVHYQLSEYYAATGEEEKSYTSLKKAFTTTDLTIDQKIMILVKYYELTEYNPIYLPQAYELLDILAEVNASEAKTYSIRGDFFFRDHRDNEALSAFKKALTLDPSKNQIWEQTLALEYSLGKTDELVADGKKAVELFPTFPTFYLYYGLGLERKGMMDDAIEQWNLGKEMVFDNPSLSGQFYASLGGAYHRSHNYQKSDEAYDKALFYNPKDVFTLNNYAYYLSLRKSKLEKARQMISQAVSIDPGNTNFFDTYAWVLFQLGEYGEALVWIEKAVAGSKTVSGEVREHYGDILFRNGKTAEAVAQWQLAKDTGKASDKIDQKINSRSIE